MGSSKVNTTIVPLSAAVKKISSEAWTSSGRLLERRRPSLRKRLGLAGAEQGRAGDRDHTEPGKSAQSGEDPHPRDRRLGTRLLSDLPKPAAGVHRGLLQCGQLGQGQRALQGGSGLNWNACKTEKGGLSLPFSVFLPQGSPMVEISNYEFDFSMIFSYE